MGIDLLDGDFYVTDPYPTYARLRDEDPLHRDETNGLWGVSRYDDIVAIERDKATFSNVGDGRSGYRPNIPADRSIIGLDDPHHVLRRNVVSRRFTPRAVGRWEDHVQATVTSLIDNALGAPAADGTCRVEAISQLAAPLPAQMIGLLLGFGADMWPKLQEWSERTIALGGGPRYHDQAGVEAAMEFAGACADLYETKQPTVTEGCPMDDVMSVWIDRERQGPDAMGGHAFGLDEIISDCLLLLDGGAETTRTVIARTLVELAGRPDQWALMRAGANLTVAVEEFIRWVTPIHNMCRVATTDVEMHGHTIRAGDQLVLMYSSANRDPAHFDDPESFDVTRHPNHHIAFGFGTHFCLGAALARLEIRSFFEEFVTRVAEIRIAPGTAPVEMPNSFVYGMSEAHLDLLPA
jgi:cytochrome P450 family 142 subfamily A polypeptide 1